MRETPAGEVLAVDDPALMRMLGERMRDGQVLTLLRSERAMTDCRPVSLFSLQTVRQLAVETGTVPDKRRFRANVYLDLGSAPGFAEDRFVDRKLRLGVKALEGWGLRLLQMWATPSIGNSDFESPYP